MCRGGQAIQLTKDHHPDDSKEKSRIKQHKGFVSENSLGVPQVNGRLAMTRSIGDVELKQYGVTAEPDIRSIEVRKNMGLDMKKTDLLLTNNKGANHSAWIRKFCQWGTNFDNVVLFFFDEGRKDPNTIISGPSTARQRNAILLVGQ